MTATRISALGYSCMEEIEAKDLKKSCQDISDKTGIELTLAIMDLAAKCCTNPKQSLTRINERLRSANIRDIDRLLPSGLSAFIKEHAVGLSLESALLLLDILVNLESRRLYRRELYYSFRRTVWLKLQKPHLTLTEAAQEVRQGVSHIGRREERRIVSRPILVKGLQYEHVVVVNPHLFRAEELYVALSRATKSVTVVGPDLTTIHTGSRPVSRGRDRSEPPSGTPSLFDDIVEP